MYIDVCLLYIFVDSDTEPTTTEDKTRSSHTTTTKSSSSEPSHTQSHTQKKDEENLKTFSKDLSMHEELPDEAKSMLADLQMDPSGIQLFENRFEIIFLIICLCIGKNVHFCKIHK